MALDFPNSPTLNQIYTDATSGFSYQWNGSVWISTSPSTTSNIQELDDISSSFNGVTTTFALTVSGTAVTPVTTNQLLISVGGVMQNPTNDFYISGSNIVFTDAPQAGLTFFGTLLGTALPLNTIADGSVTPVKLSTGGPSWDTDGDVTITGTGTTALLVQGNARVTGILTVGTGSITINGTTDRINVGTGLTLSSGGITAGVITATSFIGDGSGLTGIISPLTVSSFNPANGATGVGITSPTITITYNTPVTVGLGTITLRTASATGTIVESFNVQTSNRVSVNQAVVTITPTSNFGSLTNYYVVVPSGAFVSNTNVGLAITTYNFTSQLIPNLLYSFGFNNQGQLGVGNTISYSSPVQIPGTNWSSISAGSQQVLATKTDGTLWSWGYNGNGTLGQSNTTYRSSPVQIPGTTWSSVTCTYGSLATKTDGTLWAWGSNFYGQLGQNNTVFYSSPVQIPGTTWSSISAGSATLATKTDGTLWAWGRNVFGELGQNNRTDISSPVQIPGTTWRSVSAVAFVSSATKTDGTLWAWGYNFYGQLAQNNVISYSSPVQIPGTTWSSISFNSYNTLATKTDGTLWSWGYNYAGQLGQNNRTQYSSPVQIPGTAWSSISNAGLYSLATKTDGTLWAWGVNSNGRLGQNNTTNRSSPVQIPGIQWKVISAGGFSLARSGV